MLFKFENNFVRKCVAHVILNKKVFIQRVNKMSHLTLKCQFSGGGIPVNSQTL